MSYDGFSITEFCRILNNRNLTLTEGSKIIAAQFNVMLVSKEYLRQEMEESWNREKRKTITYANYRINHGFDHLFIPCSYPIGFEDKRKYWVRISLAGHKHFIKELSAGGVHNGQD